MVSYMINTFKSVTIAAGATFELPLPDAILPLGAEVSWTFEVLPNGTDIGFGVVSPLDDEEDDDANNDSGDDGIGRVGDNEGNINGREKIEDDEDDEEDDEEDGGKSDNEDDDEIDDEDDDDDDDAADDDEDGDLEDDEDDDENDDDDDEDDDEDDEDDDEDHEDEDSDSLEGKVEVVVELQHYAESDGKARGHCVAMGRPLVLRWDNSHSWLTAKEVKYNISVGTAPPLKDLLPKVLTGQQGWDWSFHLSLVEQVMMRDGAAHHKVGRCRQSGCDLSLSHDETQI